MLEDRLKQEEGYRARPYLDTVGKLSIGYGRNLVDVGLSRDERDYLGISMDFLVEDLNITEEQADYLLKNDIGKAREAVRDDLPWVDRLDPARQDVLFDMAFNMGIGGLLGFHHALIYAKLGLYENAAQEILSSKAAKQAPNRYKLLAQIMRTGEEVANV